MDDVYIVNYCHPGCEPLKSITRLSEPESFALARELSAKNNGTAFNRFGDDYKYYYPERMETEKWLYDRFVSLGGKPETEHPYYFVLQGSDFLHEWFGRGKITKIALDVIAEKDISFTFGDSQAMMHKPTRREPFLKSELVELIKSHHGNISELLEEIQSQYKYMEAQLWTEKYLKKDA